MNQVTLWRLYVLRAGYLLIVVGLGLTTWPDILHHEKHWELMQSVVSCVLGGISLMALLGLRYPLQMLPLLMFELVWKSLWLMVVAVPLWSAHLMDDNTAATAFACLVGAVFLFVMPWSYVYANYIRRPGERWH